MRRARPLAAVLTALGVALCCAGVASAATLTVTPATQLAREGQLVAFTVSELNGQDVKLVQVARGPGYAYCGTAGVPGSGIRFSGINGTAGNVRVETALRVFRQDDSCRQAAMPAEVSCETDASRSCAVELIDAATGATVASAPIVFAAAPPPPDTTPAQTTITRTSPSVSVDTDTVFEFASDEPSATFECRIDSAPFSRCTSPYAAGLLATGSHTFEVRSVDGAGNRDASPASVTFTAHDKAYWDSLREGSLFPFTAFGPFSCSFSVAKRSITVRGNLRLRRRTRLTVGMFSDPPNGVRPVRLVKTTTLPAAGPGAVALKLRLTPAGATYLRRRSSAAALFGVKDFAGPGSQRSRSCRCRAR